MGPSTSVNPRFSLEKRRRHLHTLLRVLDSIQTQETIETLRSFKQRRDNIALF